MTDTAGPVGTRGSVAMKGGGYYSEHTRGAKDVIDNTAELALAALADIDVGHSGEAFAVADFGAADGGTSVDMMRALVEQVRRRAPSRPITVTYTDLPHNDFSALFRMLDGQREDVSSYVHEHADVFTFATGASFYQPIFPPATLDFGFSATAMHWLSALPSTIPDHVHMVGARGAVLDAFREHAMADWERLLLHRARELRPGARLVMSNFCVDEQGRYLGSTGGVNMFDTFNVLWHGLAEEGVIGGDEYARTAFPQFYKTVEEYQAPLVERTSPVHAAGLRLESIETRVVGCPYAAQFERDGDAGAFAAAYVPTLRSWSEVVFAGGLDSQRAPAERGAIVDEFYSRYEAQVAASPEGHAMDYVHAYMVVSKVAD